MAVLEGRNILHADVVEADIVRGLLHAVEPWLDVVEIKPNDIAFPRIRFVVFYIQTHELHKIGDFLILGKLREGGGPQKQHRKQAS